jgi:hypothetical protein
MLMNLRFAKWLDETDEATAAGAYTRPLFS